MKFWQRWLRRRETESIEKRDVSAPTSAEGGTIPLPKEPFVFECRDCGKVFEMRRRRATCPECDSENVEIVSE